VIAALKAPTDWTGAPTRFPEVGDCTAPPGEGTCTRTECRYHLAHRGRWDHRLAPTRDCALAVANEGPHTMEEVARVLGVSKERVRQLEESALEKLKRSPLRRFYDESDD
jgi:hypothetical protein